MARKSKKDETTIPIIKIPKGHARTGWIKKDDGYYLVICHAKEYAEPGTYTRGEKGVNPVVAVKLWGKEQARIMGMSFMVAAEEMEQNEQKEGGGNG